TFLGANARRGGTAITFASQPSAVVELYAALLIVVQRLFPVGRLCITHVQRMGFGGSGHSRSQHVESSLHHPVAEIVASQSTLGYAPRGITGQVCRRLYSQLGGRL